MRLQVRSALLVSALVLRRCAQLAQCMQARHLQLCAAVLHSKKYISGMQACMAEPAVAKLHAKLHAVVRHTCGEWRLNFFCILCGYESGMVNQMTNLTQATGGCHTSVWAGRGESQCRNVRSSGGS